MSDIIKGKQLWQFQTGDPFSDKLGTVQLRKPEFGRMQSVDILLPGMQVRGRQDVRKDYDVSRWPTPERGNALGERTGPYGSSVAAGDCCCVLCCWESWEAGTAAAGLQVPLAITSAWAAGRCPSKGETACTAVFR